MSDTKSAVPPAPAPARPESASDRLQRDVLKLQASHDAVAAAVRRAAEPFERVEAEVKRLAASWAAAEERSTAMLVGRDLFATFATFDRDLRANADAAIRRMTEDARAAAAVEKPVSILDPNRARIGFR